MRLNSKSKARLEVSSRCSLKIRRKVNLKTQSVARAITRITMHIITTVRISTMRRPRMFMVMESFMEVSPIFFLTPNLPRSNKRSLSTNLRKRKSIHLHGMMKKRK